MRPDKAAVLAWEERWSRPVALATFASILLIVAAIVVASQGVGGGSGESELLRNVDAHRGAQLLSSILQAFGVGLLAVPLYYLFRAAKARSEKMRGQLVGVVIAAPLFLAALAILGGVSTLHAASDFVANEVPRLTAKGVALSSDHANEAANDTITEAPLRPLAAGFGLGGQIGFVARWSTRRCTRCGPACCPASGARPASPSAPSPSSSSSSRCSGSSTWARSDWLGPGGRPPAWPSGEAEPWPTPAEKAAAEMERRSWRIEAEEGDAEDRRAESFVRRKR